MTEQLSASRTVIEIHDRIVGKEQPVFITTDDIREISGRKTLRKQFLSHLRDLLMIVFGLYVSFVDDVIVIECSKDWPSVHALTRKE